MLQSARQFRATRKASNRKDTTMLIAQLSDPHFLPKGMLAFGKVDTAGFLERAVAHLNGLDLDAVLITGDLTNDGDEAVYAECAAIVAGLRAPYFVMTGNHDDRALMRARFGGSYLPAEGPLCYVIEQFAVRVIALDSLVDGQALGRARRGADRLARCASGGGAGQAHDGGVSSSAVSHRDRPSGLVDAARCRGAGGGDRAPSRRSSA